MGMHRTTVARSRELASLLVVAVLLSVAVAPAGLASVQTPAATHAGAAPGHGVGVAVAVISPDPGQAESSPVFGPSTTPVGTAPPPKPPTGEPPTGEPPPSTATLGCSEAPTGLRPSQVVHHGSRARKVVALTFDDGYGPATTIRILGILRHFQVNATFFPTGRALQLYPDIWREIAHYGFPIGDHTYDHHDLAGLCFATQVRELTRQQEVAREVLGFDPIPVMRPPYGSRDALTPFAARAAGDSRVVLWDVDTRDWSGISSWAVYKRARIGGNGSIVLMHTFPTATAEALPRIIASYRNRGYEFVTIGQLLGIPGPVPFS
jgi:peptidoglycan-N-acetylglucosamine deacetylase